MNQEPKLYRQNQQVENVICATRSLLELLDVRVTGHSVKEILNLQPDYPSLAAISGALEEWNIENMSVRLSPKELEEAPYPALAFMDKNKGHFVVLTEYKEGMVRYFDPQTGWQQTEMDVFAEAWTGISLLVSRTPYSGEVDFERKKRLAFLTGIRKPVVLSILGLVFLLGFWAGFEHYSDVLRWWLPLLGIKILGAVLTVLLVSGQYSQNKLLDKLCPAGEKINCEKVLKSSAANLFGWLSLSEAGAFYFIGGVFTLLLGLSGTHLHTLIWLFTAINLLTLPFSLFSIYYQWRVVSQWCTYCLITMALFWAEFALLFGLLWDVQPAIAAAPISLLAVGFLLPLGFWILFRPVFLRSLQLPLHKKNLRKLKSNPAVFRAVMSGLPVVDLGDFDTEFVMGKRETGHRITAVLSPFCPHCAVTFQVLERLLSRFGEQMHIVFRFSVPNEVEEKSNFVAHALLKLGLEQGSEIMVRTLAEWYALSDKERSQYEKWIAERVKTEEKNNSVARELLMKHMTWAYEIHIKGTPAILVNDRMLPLTYEAADLIPYFQSLNRKT